MCGVHICSKNSSFLKNSSASFLLTVKRLLFPYHLYSIILFTTNFFNALLIVRELKLVIFVISVTLRFYFSVKRLTILIVVDGKG